LTNYGGLEKTKKAVSELSELMNTYEGGSCAMYAFEKEIPKISQTKLDGMAKFYGMSSDDATEYFKLHTEADIRHAAAWRNILETTSTKTDDLIQIADKSISAQNLLLDSCYEAYC
jgi:pyrroloquinoline-quinone synthase